MKLLSRLLAVCVALLFTALLVGGEGNPEIKKHVTSTQVNAMKSICVRVALKEGTTEAVRDWFRTLIDRREETLESLKNEEVIVESAFLDRQPDGDFLIYYMRAQDIEKAMAVFQNSSLAIDAYHKSCWGKYCGESTHLEQLLQPRYDPALKIFTDLLLPSPGCQLHP